MPGRLAIDFGTSNTVVAAWDDLQGEGVPLALGEYGRAITYHRESGRETISVIPSLIHYAEDGRRWIGAQVLARGLYGSERTFRWMKRYIGRRSPIRIQVNGRSISHSEAGHDFLSAVLHSARGTLDIEGEEVALTAPVEAFEHYETWLAEVAETAGMPEFRLIDEPSAAALGYGVPIQPGDVYLVFDFGGGTLDVAVVLVDVDDTQGRRCRVLGKAGADLGGASIDGWLYQEVLKQCQRADGDEDIRALSRPLLVECERVKELLSFQDEAEVRVESAEHRIAVRGKLTRAHLEAVFDEHGVFTEIDWTIRRSLNAARERGYDEENIKAVLMLGGSSLIPSIRQLVGRIFGRDRVRLDRPLDAVARGAAAFIAGVDFYDHIQHDYAIRHVDPVAGDYGYRLIVKRGTPYPTRRAAARVTLKASHDGQTEFGIAVFELGGSTSRRTEPNVELIFDARGAARFRPVTPEEEDRRANFWINERRPTFLVADPPARRGEPRFEVEFDIDENKRLLVTARDLLSKAVILRDHPVIKLI